jgi:hypothetical protein
MAKVSNYSMSISLILKGSVPLFLSDNGYTKIYSTEHAFAALKADGSITAWGASSYGGTTPSGSGYTKIYSNHPTP